MIIPANREIINNKINEIYLLNSKKNKLFLNFLIQLNKKYNFEIDKVLNKYFGKTTILPVDYLTEGQVSTCLIAKDYLDIQKEPRDYLAELSHHFLALPTNQFETYSEILTISKNLVQKYVFIT